MRSDTGPLVFLRTPYAARPLSTAVWGVSMPETHLVVASLPKKSRQVPRQVKCSGVLKSPAIVAAGPKATPVTD
jgi:hypothetical protein